MSSLLRTGPPLEVFQPLLRHLRDHSVNAVFGIVVVRSGDSER